uniref:Regulatory protein zeste n=1 Tax=Timema bartmani TaxID=61472 RepID=A0A7R9F4R5_9NEOP|nr:unnamed protein product [Timema bartmani]
MSTNKEERLPRTGYRGSIPSARKLAAVPLRSNAELVDYMSNHLELASGRFSCPMGNAAIEQQWEVLASLLEEFGPKKTTTQWKTVWRDLKCRARARLADLNRASKATGNNSKAVPPLTELERKVLAIIGTVCSIGDPSTRERGLNTVVSEELTLPDLSFPLTAELYVLEPTAGVSTPEERDVEPIAGPAGVSTPLERESLRTPARRLSTDPPMAKRRRTDVQELDDTVKIFKIIQEDNNSSYKEIATSISNLSSSLASNQQVQASNISQLVAVQQEANKLTQESIGVQREQTRQIMEPFVQFINDQ